jgi:hypothetical protein
MGYVLRARWDNGTAFIPLDWRDGAQRMRTENFGGKELWAGDPCQAEGRGGLKQSTYRRAMSGWGEPTHLKDLSPFEAQKRLDQVPSAAFSSAQREGEREGEDGHVDDPCKTAEEHAKHTTQCKKLCSSCYCTRHLPEVSFCQTLTAFS